MKKNVFTKYYFRNSEDLDTQKAQNFSNRMDNAPVILKMISLPIAAVLGRSSSLDKKLMKLPILNLFTKFITGNAKLISMASSDVNAAQTSVDSSLPGSDYTHDVIVIGSGPGGSIAALRAVEKGKSVLVLESGGAYAPGSIEHHSLNQTVNQFRNGGLSFIWGLKPVLYAEGSTLGGGSEVNSGLYHRLEGKHRSRILKTIDVSESEWNSLEELVEREISVQKAPEENVPNHGLVKGAKEIGLVSKEVPRWRKYSPLEEHQSMQVTYLAKALALGVKVVTNINVSRINPHSERIEVVGVVNGKIVTMYTREVILAAGTIETPRILNRSKLIKGNLELNFHPMLRAVGMQSTFINDGDLFPSWQAWTPDLNYKYGYSVSTYPYLSATLQSLGEEHPFTPAELSKMAAYFSSFALADSKARLIKFRNKLIPIVIWGRQDKESMKNSLSQLKSILVAGEAVEVWPKSGLSPITTVHLFGTLPLGRCEEVNNLGQLSIDPRIRISDGSLMPHAPWGNPQGAIMVLCELLAKRNS